MKISPSLPLRWGRSRRRFSTTHAAISSRSHRSTERRPSNQCYSEIARMTRQGLPTARTPSGMSRVTTLPAPMTDREPTRTPGQRIAPPPTHTSAPISIGLANSCFRRSTSVHRMRGRVNLNCRAELRVFANSHLAHVEHDAVEVEEHPLPEQDVRAVVAEKRRLHPDCLTPGPEQVSQDTPPLVLLGLAGRIEGLAEVASPLTGWDEFRVEGSYSSPASILSRSLRIESSRRITRVGHSHLLRNSRIA